MLERFDDSEWDGYLADQERRRGGSSFGQASGAAGSVAARPGYNPQRDPNSSAYVKHERTPGDGKGLGRIESALPAASPMLSRTSAPAQAVPTSAASKATGVGAGAAAAGSFGLSPLLGVLGQVVTAGQQKAAARKAAQQRIAVDHAASLGFPMYGVKAQASNEAAEDLEGTNYLKDLLPLLQKQRGGHAGR